MLLSGFASPRRLVLLAAVSFVIAVLFLGTTSYGKYLPKYDLPSFPYGHKGEEKSSLEEDQLGSGAAETSVKGGLGISTAKSETPVIEISTVTTSLSSASTTSSTTTAPKFEIKTGDGYGFRVYDGVTTTTDGTSSTAVDQTSTTAVETSLPTLESNGSVIETVDTSQHDHGHGFAQYMTYDQTQTNIRSLIKSWLPLPVEGHEPPYETYRDKDYDPNLWEGFQWDNDYYLKNGIKKLTKEQPHVQPFPYLPYPAYNTPEWKAEWLGEHVPCEGARGRLLNDSLEDIATAWSLIPHGYPAATLGDASAVNADASHCFDRYNRFGPYGYGQGERGDVEGWQRPVVKPDWSSVRWDQLQEQCLELNRERYAPNARQPTLLRPDADFSVEAKRGQPSKRETPAYHPRTAVLIRTWQGYEYAENDLQTIRAMMTELALISGGEYQVFLLVAVGDHGVNVTSNSQVYADILSESVPREFRSIAVLWDEELLQSLYPDVGDWSVKWHQYMPVQWFSETHQEFDFIWNLEPDTRFTGNHYQFLESLSAFAKETPRKFLWERNQRYYIPSAGSFSDYVLDSVEAVETGMREGMITPVWGPQPYNPTEQTPLGQTPPTSERDDQFAWGEGDEADLITLSPIFDPKHTEWEDKDMVWNYVPGIHPNISDTDEDPADPTFHYPGYANVPRRATFSPLLRFSRLQLHAMHVENTAGRALASGMFPASIALQHGLKAVYAPHPVWADRRWLAWYADAIFNANENKTAQWGQQNDSVYNTDRSHNFGGLSYSSNSGFPTVLYRRWLGFAAYEDEQVSPIDGLGGKGYEDRGFIVDLGNGGPESIGGKGRMCLPGMLLHPVLKVKEADEPGERPFMDPGG
ncbi:hypothetical protein LTR02_014003 [Friedmanniomyces endolithicus]|nr:hypothetical protein LTR94_005750 [Friedmanniomyces endolithicus]KAK0809368.1 hypothetical protein LTR59_002612 [Friedmanniomyces endolithicus]KAK0819702.1 hypothetical protein LTR38_000455 [Friedmanniomyces endolithicus]KAK0822060.1 hypothetical protein LTR75_000195 [Friedmanniomyces endolithicus]KAK0858261.1 hypothetical protein LTR03_000270 [Friedmanniomyces endolithicus]